MKKRLYGNIKDLKKTGCNSTVDYYRLQLWIIIDGDFYPVTAEQGFNGYTKTEIYHQLKEKIKADLASRYQIETC